MRSPLHIVAATRRVLVVADLSDDKMFQVLHITIEIHFVDDSAEAAPASTSTARTYQAIQLAPELAVGNPMRRNLGERAAYRPAGQPAKMPHQFRRQSIVNPPFMPVSGWPNRTTTEVRKIAANSSARCRRFRRRVRGVKSAVPRARVPGQPR